MENEVVENEQEVTTPVTEPVVAEQPEKTYTKAEVQALMKKRVDRSHNRVWNRYGVKSFEELDDQIKDYRTIKDGYAGLQAKYDDLVRENALLKNNVLPEKYDDVKAYFKGTNTDFTEENLIKVLANHPEWLRPQQLRIESLGVNNVSKPAGPTEKELASKYFGTKI